MNAQINERKVKWNNFMSGAGNVESMVMISYMEGLENKPFVTDGCYKQNSDWIVKKYNLMRENMSWLPDDSIPYLDMLTGTEIFAEAFGCKVVYPQANNPFALHKISNVSEISRLKTPNLWETRLADLFEMVHQLRSRTEKEAVVRLPDIQSPLDIAALIMKKEEFYMGIVDEPEAIRELIAMTYDLLTQFLDEWFKAFGREFIAHYPDYYMEYGITLSEDEVGIVSASTFIDMFLKELNELSDRYGRIGIHCCANSRHQWDNIRKINNLCLLNVAQPEEIVKEAYTFFKDTCGQIHSFYGEGEIDTWGGQLPEGARIVFQLPANNREDALYKADALKRLRFTGR